MRRGYTSAIHRSYPALQFLIIANKALGIGVALCGTIAGVLLLVGGIALGDADSPELAHAFGLLGAGFGVLVIVGSLLAGLGLVATGEWINLHVNLEQNTRPRTESASPDEDLRWVA